MYNQSKAHHQSIKVEKENENIKLRKKINNLATEKRLINKKETVWDRLSRIKKVCSTENVVVTGRSRPHLAAKTFQRYQPLRQSPRQPTRKSLLPASRSINKPSNSPHRILAKKSTGLHDFNSRRFLHALPDDEIITSRSLSENSKFSSESAVDFFKLSNESLRFNAQKVNESSEDSDEVYTLAPLLTSCSEDESKPRIRTLNNFREFLRRKKSVALEDIELVKDAIKSDSRCESLEKNPKILKDILKTQLQNILMQEFAVKKALDKLESSVSLQRSEEFESKEPSNKIINYPGHNKQTQKFEVDVIFKNVPSLDKEIAILRALGEKLEATLQSTASHRTRCNAMSQVSIGLTMNSMIAAQIGPPVMVKLRHTMYDLTAKHYAQVAVHLIGIRQCVGIVNEFFMAQKTIVELKREQNRPFYIPGKSENEQLIRTSFEKLKETPNELLRHVKPKNSQIAFNVLDQDPVFFYNEFRKHSNVPRHLSTKQDQYEKYQFPVKQAFREGGDTNFWNETDRETLENYEDFLLDQKESESMNLFTLESGCDTANEMFNTPTILEPVARRKQRRRLKRRVTPMPVGYNYYPKNSFLKTILVGIVQMSVFLVFIMALTYPDAGC